MRNSLKPSIMENYVLVPAEWDPHRAIWTAWPSGIDLWPTNLEAVRGEVAAMVTALASGDRMKVLAHGAEAVASATRALKGRADVIPYNYGDIWLRDTGPVFSRRLADQTPQAEVFSFNGWGGKYNLPHDDEVAEGVAKLSSTPVCRHSFILEGGSIEIDGCGTALTTRQCLLNPNRNREWDEKKAEAALREAYGIRKVIWLDEGLLNDHTDGHIDNLARFTAPGKVVCQYPNGKDDPNETVLQNIEKLLRSSTDADGRPLDVQTICSPGLVKGKGDQAVAASHMNFVIGNKSVVVPSYNESAGIAQAALTKIFPGRDVIALSARALITEGGAFHCITQQEPL